MVIDITVNGTADWWCAAAGASGHSYQGRQHTSSSNFDSYEHERRGPARKLPSSGTAECGERCRVISRGRCCSHVFNVFLIRDNLGLTYMSAAGAVQFTEKATAGAASARARRNSHSEDTVATHSDLNQVIVIN